MNNIIDWEFFENEDADCYFILIIDIWRLVSDSVFSSILIENEYYSSIFVFPLCWSSFLFEIVEMEGTL